MPLTVGRQPRRRYCASQDRRQICCPGICRAQAPISRAPIGHVSARRRRHDGVTGARCSFVFFFLGPLEKNKHTHTFQKKRKTNSCQCLRDPDAIMAPPASRYVADRCSRNWSLRATYARTTYPTAVLRGAVSAARLAADGQRQKKLDRKRKFLTANFLTRNSELMRIACVFFLRGISFFSSTHFNFSSSSNRADRAHPKSHFSANGVRDAPTLPGIAPSLLEQLRSACPHAHTKYGGRLFNETGAARGDAVCFL